MQKSMAQVVSENEQLKQQIASLEMKDHLLSESLSGYWQWNITNNHLLTSPQWQKSVGILESEVTNTLDDWKSRVHPEDLEPTIQLLNEHLQGKTPCYEARYRLRKRNGEYLHIIDRGLAAFDESGSPYLAIGSFTDITEMVIKEKQLSESENSLNTILNCMSEGILVIDAEGKFIYANDNFTKHVGLTAEQMKGRTPMDPDWRVIHEDGSPYPGDTHPSTITITTGKAVKNDIQGVYKGEELNWLLANSEPIFDQNDQHLIGAVITFADITERKQTEEHIQQLAFNDHLTGLGNRAQLERVLNFELEPSSKPADPFAVLFVDIDRLKPINDSRGHSFGDRLLCAIAQRFNTQLRRTDTLVRFGGDEFVAVLPNTDRDGAQTVAEQLLACLEDEFDIGGDPLTVSASLGISLYPENGKTSEQLLKFSDRAMYSAKSNGGNGLQYFNQELHSEDGKSSRLELDLKNAIDSQQLHIHFQPQIDAKTTNIIGAEALLRWEHPTLGNIPPGRFIPLAEQSGSIVKIGNWLIETICQQIDSMRQQGLPTVPISINLSAKQLSDSALLPTITTSMDRWNISSDMLILEITESVLMSRTEQTSRNINQIKALGLNLSIDDFGTGYSSLAYLTNLPISSLKIDRAFIKDLDSKAADTIIVKTIIDLAKNLSLGIIAEGVETNEQLEILRSLDCERIQGYFFSKPLPYQSFIEFLLNNYAPSENHESAPAFQ